MVCWRILIRIIYEFGSTPFTESETSTLNLLFSKYDQINPCDPVFVFDLSFGDDFVEPQHGVENEFPLAIKGDYAVIDGQVG